MGYSFTEKKRIRKSFSKRSEVDQIPNLLEIQKESYRKLLQKGVPFRSSASTRDCRLLSSRFSRLKVTVVQRRSISPRTNWDSPRLMYESVSSVD